MNISELSIRRPVLSTVFNILIVIFGVIGYQRLGVREYPNVDNPIINVSTSYAGANPEIIENQITIPLEEQINSVPGIRSLSSTSSVGSSRITVEFNFNVDMERAANDVRDKVSRAQRFLPRDCDPPTVSKQDADGRPIVMIGIYSDERNMMDVSEIADLSIAERLQTVDNVSSINIWGEQRYAMRLWLDTEKMANYGITPSDVRTVLVAENVELPSGKLRSDKTDLTVRTRGYLKTPDEFKNIIIKNDGLGIVRVSDIARVELSSQDIESYLRVNGKQCVVLAIIAQPGSNQIQIADEIYKRLDEIKKDIPDDIQMEVINDTTRFVRASINEVKETIIMSFLLVIIIIFLFLRNTRVTLIPIMVIPISLIGSFFVLYLMGYSINTLTLLSVVLSVGLVVDDAIVMVENIYLKIEHGLTPKAASIAGAKELLFAVISTSITLVCVFVPIMMVTGMTGKLLIEFAVTVTGAILFSTFAALTFIPMLCSKILKSGDNNKFYIKTEPFFIWLNNFYSRWLQKFMNHRGWSWAIIGVALILIIFMWQSIPSETAPMEDRSEISINVRMPEGSGFKYTLDYSKRVASIIDSIYPDYKYVQNFLNSSFNSSTIMMKDIADRDISQMDVANKLSATFQKESVGRISVQQTMSLSTSRGGMPVQYVLQATTMDKLRKYLPLFLDECDKSEILTQVNPNLLFNSPELNVYMDRDKANMLGVKTNELQSAMQYALSGQRYGYFYMNNQQYQIMGELERSQSKTPEDLSKLYVRNNQGKLIQLNNLITTREDVSPANVYHFNRFRSATVSAGLKPGYTLGEGIEEMDRIADKVLDETFRTSLSGASKDYADSSSNLVFMFSLALIMIFLVLSAQFESFKDPSIILTTVPLALFGALLFIIICGQTMNLYSQIALIMLIGLTAKNGILIVEFANQRQAAGLPKMEAIIGASQQRLRPILMTSFSTIIGLVPLAFASGEGANGRVAIGVTIIGGLFIATIISLFIVPAVYSYLATDRKTKLKDETPMIQETSKKDE